EPTSRERANPRAIDARGAVPADVLERLLGEPQVSKDNHRSGEPFLASQRARRMNPLGVTGGGDTLLGHRPIALPHVIKEANAIADAQLDESSASLRNSGDELVQLASSSRDRCLNGHG